MKTQQPKPVRWTDLNRHPVMWLGFGFGSGLAPKGPGTAGTLLGLLLFLPILLWSEAAAWGVLALALVFGSYIVVNRRAKSVCMTTAGLFGTSLQASGWCCWLCRSNLGSIGQWRSFFQNFRYR